jgi:hypothetical protein
MEAPAPVRFAGGILRAVQLFYKYRTRTMIHLKAYAENLAMVNVVLANMSLKNGAIVECGTWKGGMAAGMIEIAGPDRRYYVFDSLEGLPPAKEIDGTKAI